MDQPSATPTSSEYKRLRSQLISDLALALVGVAFAVSGLIGGVNVWRLGAGVIMIAVGLWAAISVNRKLRRLATED